MIHQSKKTVLLTEWPAKRFVSQRPFMKLQLTMLLATEPLC